VRLRALASILAVAALVAAGVTFSGATFTAASANPGNEFSTAAVFPSVTLTDPGTPLRGTVTLDASTAGTIVSVTIQRSPAGAGTWTDVCTDNSSPYSCSFDTAVPADGLYDLRATANTGSGTVTSAVVANRRLDNTAPSVAMTDPGTPLSGTVSLGAAPTDIGGSGVSSVSIQRSPAGDRHLDGHLHRQLLALLLLLRHDRRRRRALRLPRSRNRRGRQLRQLHGHEPPHRQRRSCGLANGSRRQHPRDDLARRHCLGRRRHPQRQDPALARRAQRLDGHLHRQQLPLLVLDGHGDLGRRRALRPARARN